MTEVEGKLAEAEVAWLVEIDAKLSIGLCNGREITVAFTDPKAIRFESQIAAMAYMQELVGKFPWMSGRLAAVEHMWPKPVSVASRSLPAPEREEWRVDDEKVRLLACASAIGTLPPESVNLIARMAHDLLDAKDANQRLRQRIAELEAK